MCLKFGLGVVKGHWKWHDNDRSYSTSYWRLYCIAILHSSSMSTAKLCTLKNVVASRGHSGWPFDRSHTRAYSFSVVTVAISCIISEIKRNLGRKFRNPARSLAYQVLKIMQKSSVYSQFQRDTDRRTHGKAISIAERLQRNAP